MSDHPPAIQKMLKAWREDLAVINSERPAPGYVFRGRFGRSEPLPAHLKVWTETGEVTTFPIFEGHVR